MLDSVRIVMVNTSHPGNIGAAARAMKNMGLRELYLVAPEDFPHDEATWRSSGATDVLDRAIVVDTLEEAVADCVKVVGTSARERRIPWPVITPRQLADDTRHIAERGTTAVVFGRESSGLTNDELRLCNAHVCIPGNPEYPVLNVAMALQVVCYEMRMAHLEQLPSGHDDAASLERVQPGADSWDEALASHDDVERMLLHLEQTLVDIDFHDPNNPRQLMTRLRRLFLRASLDKMEVNILRGMLKAAQAKARPESG